MNHATLARGSAGKRRLCYFVQLWRKCCASSCARASPSSRCASCSSWASLASGSRRFHRVFLLNSPRAPRILASRKYTIQKPESPSAGAEPLAGDACLPKSSLSCKEPRVGHQLSSKRTQKNPIAHLFWQPTSQEGLQAAEFRRMLGTGIFLLHPGEKPVNVGPSLPSRPAPAS